MIITKSHIFRQAHVVTKRTVRAGDSYSATFSICLKMLYEKYKKDMPVRYQRLVESKISDDHLVSMVGVRRFCYIIKDVAKKIGDIWNSYKVPGKTCVDAPKFYRLPYKYNDIDNSWTVQLKVVKALMQDEEFALAAKTGEVEFGFVKNPVVEKLEKGTYNNKQKAQKAAKTRQNRAGSRLMGVEGKLIGTPKQVALAEELRLRFLENIADNNAHLFVAHSAIAQKAKFWLDNQDKPHAKLEKLMAQVVVATKTANDIGVGNSGYDEQINIRANALAALGQQP